MELRSNNFPAGGHIPAAYTCEGADRSPHLAWSGAPATTRSYALIIDDPDAPAGIWTHWGICDLSPDLTQLEEGFSQRAQAAGVRQVINDFKRADYGGPCPPPGHGVHHYRFRLFALDVAHMSLPSRADCRALERALRPHVVAQAQLTGTYSR